MTGTPNNGLIVAGAVLALLGALAIAVPMFTTEETTEIARIGDVTVTAKEETPHVIPSYLGPAGLAVGVILVGFAFVRRR
jgi:hypothetical protein